jgi:hypothetical protein
MMCVAMKDFVAAGEDIIRNQLVDGSQFRNVPALIATRYLRPATTEEIKSARYESQDAPAAKRNKAPTKSKFRIRKRR